jgi:hypothetical protein
MEFLKASATTQTVPRVVHGTDDRYGNKAGGVRDLSMTNSDGVSQLVPRTTRQ